MALVASPALFAAESKPSKECVLYLRLHEAELIDKSVKVDVIAVRPAKTQPLAEKFQIFHVMTQDTRNDRFGGEIVAVVPKAEAEEFVKRYGLYAENPRRNPRTKSLTATLRSTKLNGIYLDLDGTAAAAIGDLRLPDGNDAGGPVRRPIRR
jgi:ribosomal protein L14